MTTKKKKDELKEDELNEIVQETSELPTKSRYFAIGVLTTVLIGYVTFWSAVAYVFFLGIRAI